MTWRDELAEAVTLWDRHGFDWKEARNRYKSVMIAAQAVLNGREPDYRAAAIEWIGDKPPDNYPGEWEQMIQTVIEQTVKPLVDAALGGKHVLTLLDGQRDEPWTGRYLVIPLDTLVSRKEQ